jgi:hypothetical protein
MLLFCPFANPLVWISVIDLEQIKEDELNMVDEHNRTRDSRMSFYMSPPKHGRKSSQFDAKRLSSLIAHKENHSPNKNRKITITARPKRAQVSTTSEMLDKLPNA